METLKTSVFIFIMVDLVNKTILHALITRGVLLEGGEGSHPYHFSKNGKKFLDFGKTCPHCGHLLVKFFIQNEFIQNAFFKFF